MSHRSSSMAERLHNREVKELKPQLTSLIDVMMLLLFYLIHTFSAEVIVQTTPKGIKLPQSTSAKQVKEMPSLEITPKGVTVDGVRICSIDDMSPEDPMLIGPLFVKLESYKKPKDKAEIMIQTDKSEEFSVVKKAMYTASKAGFTDFTILVSQEGE